MMHGLAKFKFLHFCCRPSIPRMSLPTLYRTSSAKSCLLLRNTSIRSLKLQPMLSRMCSETWRTELMHSIWTIPQPSRTWRMSSYVLRDLKNRTDAFHPNSSRAFQNLTDVILCAQRPEEQNWWIPSELFQSLPELDGCHLMCSETWRTELMHSSRTLPEPSRTWRTSSYPYSRFWQT